MKSIFYNALMIGAVAGEVRSREIMKSSAKPEPKVSSCRELSREWTSPKNVKSNGTAPSAF
jgi:hypothetical protein